MLPPLFLQTCSEVGEERAKFSPRRQINHTKEARFFFFWGGGGGGGVTFWVFFVLFLHYVQI